MPGSSSNPQTRPMPPGTPEQLELLVQDHGFGAFAFDHVGKLRAENMVLSRITLAPSFQPAQVGLDEAPVVSAHHGQTVAGADSEPGEGVSEGLLRR